MCIAKVSKKQNFSFDNGFLSRNLTMPRLDPQPTFLECIVIFLLPIGQLCFSVPGYSCSTVKNNITCAYLDHLFCPVFHWLPQARHHPPSSQ